MSFLTPMKNNLKIHAFSRKNKFLRGRDKGIVRARIQIKDFRVERRAEK